MQENKCGVYILKNTHEEGHAYHFIHSKKKTYERNDEYKNDDKERKRMRKEGRKV